MPKNFILLLSLSFLESFHLKTFWNAESLQEQHRRFPQILLTFMFPLEPTERGPFGTVGDPWPQEMKECSLKKERGADKGEEPSSPWEGRQTALPFWNLREVWENKNSVASGERASSEPVDGFNLPISQLLNCLRTTYQNSARSSELSGYQSPSLKEEDTVFRKGTSNSPASPGAFCVFRATTQPLRLKTFWAAALLYYFSHQALNVVVRNTWMCF